VNWALYALAAFMGFGVLLTVSSIGKPRKPLEASSAAWVVLFNAGWIVLAVLAAMRLS
jgi:hypothetical protein